MVRLFSRSAICPGFESPLSASPVIDYKPLTPVKPKKRTIVCFKSDTLPLSHCGPRGGPMCFFRKTLIFQGSRGVPTLCGGGQFFPGGGGGVQMIISNRNLSKLGFSRQGVRTPYSSTGSAHVLPSLVAQTQ